jgi:hypothetical protein
MVSPVLAVLFTTPTGAAPVGVPDAAADGVVAAALGVGVAVAVAVLGVAVVTALGVAEEDAEAEEEAGAGAAAGPAGSQAVSSRVLPAVSAQTSEMAAWRRVRTDMVTSPQEDERGYEFLP